jgi:type IV pilus assembly protein PilV
MTTQIKFEPALPACGRGFSLVEVMVALIIIAVGMLGIAKLQALALSTTESSGVRSLVAIEAASLAASMHANRDYWVGGPPPPVTNVTVSTTGPYTTSVAIDVPALATAQTCATTTVGCTSAAQIAAYDVQQWGAALAQVVPAALATITCNVAVPSSCTIQITWQENVVGTNNATAAASSTAGVLNSPVYTLYVEP